MLKLTIEQRELYNYIMGTNPFKTAIERSSVRFPNKIKNIIRDARGTYNATHGTSGFDCFEDADVTVVFEAILSNKLKEAYMTSNAMDRLTLDDVVRIVNAIGSHWFDADTMRFWGTQIKSELLDNLCFVSGEYTADLGSRKRRYTIRQFNLDTLNIEDASEFLGYATASRAIIDAKKIPCPVYTCS